ncbi:MAG: ABC transporter ATP-binding protein, partial [Actinomycetota bacterium]|nr:ABC transporter ATP-binding protein [Actinomycetota bacterium]
MSTGESSQPLLLIDRLTVTLPTAARPLVDGVTMRVDRGEIVGLVGESGSGKSVTAKAVLGLLPARAVASGRVLLAGIDMLTADASTVRRSRLRTAAMVFQDPRAAVNPVRSVGDFLTEGLRALPGVSRRTALSRAAHLLDQVGIADSVRALRRYPHEFSGGMLQRVVIAAALAGDPDLLLADEPTTALDPTTQAEVLAILLRLRAERGLGMVFVTHDLDLAAALCHRVCVM